jgi:hypothetical protein
VLVLGLQPGLILLLGDRTPLRVRPPAHAPLLQLAEPASAEWLALNDPTLFALPHRRGFAGPAWLEPPAPPDPTPDQSEPPRWLSLTNGQTVPAPDNSIDSGTRVSLDVLSQTAPELPFPKAAPLTPALRRSTLHLRGGLAARQLLSLPELPDQPASDLLRPTVVQVVVDAEGRTFSAAIPPAPEQTSGSAAADELALRLARSARFERIKSGAARSASSALATLTCEKWFSIGTRCPSLPPPRRRTNELTK